MNAIGGIGYSSYELYTRDYQSQLESDVAKVNDTEAEWGAQLSDSVRFLAKEQSRDEKAVPFSTYVKRAIQFGQTVKKEAGKKDEAKESCPIAKARSESLIGENAPLNWLVADQMGGHTGTPQREDFVVDKPAPDFQSPAAVFLPDAPVEVASGGTLLSQEWLLTPAL